ncbi:MAG: DUF2029 domain-containing protein [Acidobacteria bacterium]|nr:DUF2029 domain-containing protein [Acidobacteriota bacterium]MBI3423982.1 DUF2029 domain-containing protein [Acidobacteriota bacterium]
MHKIWSSFAPANVYRKDFINGYLLGQGLVKGVDPYQPMDALARQFAFNSPTRIFPHPTPHTVPCGLLIALLSGWGYERAAQLWLVFELLCLLAALVLLVRWWGTPAVLKWVALCGWALCGWGPLTEDLWVGQLNALLLLLLLLSWRSLRAGHELSGGALLGGALVLKLMAWPVVLFLLWQRRWRSVLAAGSVTLAGHLLALAWIGVEGVKRYYTEVGPTVTALYRGFDANFSAWTVGWRLFVGTEASFARGLVAPPLIAWPAAARLFTLLVPCLVLALGLALARRVKDFDVAFALLLCVSLLVNPVAWSHYLVIALLPLAVVWRYLRELDFPMALTRYTLLVTLVCSLPHSIIRNVAALFQTSVTATGSPVVPFAAGLLTLATAAALIALMFLLRRVEAHATEEVAPVMPAFQQQVSVAS